jgi:hypothetical protein
VEDNSGAVDDGLNSLKSKRMKGGAYSSQQGIKIRNPVF